MDNAREAPTIAVTGSAGYVGSQLLQELENDDSLGKLVAIDTKPLPMPFHNINAYRLDLTQPADVIFHENQINTVCHLAFDLRESREELEASSIRQNNILGLENLLRACKIGNVDHFIYLSSHTVYGAHGDNPVPITEDAPLRPLTGFQYSRSKVLSEEILQQFAEENPSVAITILRCCIVMGPGNNNYVAKALDQSILVKLAGYDPPIQFIHPQDLARILALFAKERRAGVFNLAGDGVVQYSRLSQILGRRMVSLPSFIAYPLVAVTWKFGLQSSAPAEGLDLIRYPMILSTGKLKQATNFQFHYTSEEALISYASSRLD